VAVTCTDSSTGGPTAWAWDFGDGTTSSDQNPPAHTYNADGSYTVALTVTGPNGSDTESKVDYISVGGNDASCDVGDDNSCVLARGDVFPTIQNIIFDSFLLTGETGTTAANTGGYVSDNDITDAGWSIYVAAEGPFADDQNSNQIPLGNEDDLTVECLTISTDDGQATPTCHTVNHVRLVSDSNKTTIISASLGTGTGTYQFTTQFVLTIPGQTVPGNYTTTIYIDRQIGSGGP
jgi:PKD repeat protein